MNKIEIVGYPEFFKVNYEMVEDEDGDVYENLCYQGKPYFSDKTELIDTFIEWEKIKPHLTSEKVKRAIRKGLDEHTWGKDMLKDLDEGIFKPIYFNYPMIEDIKDDYDLEKVKKYDQETYDAYMEHINKEYESDEDYDQNYVYCEWIKPKSWFSYQVCHRCYNVSYYEKEFGEILYPELDWYIVHTKVHAMAMGLNKDGHVDKIYDMNWYDFETKDLMKYLKDINVV